MNTKYQVYSDTFEIKNYDGAQSAFFHVFRHCNIGSVIKLGNVWEPHLHRVFEKYVNKDSIVLEGGCHIGTHSIKLSKLSKELICFEPLKQSNDLLKKNLLLNDCNNVTVYNAGISDTISKTKFAWLPFGNIGGSGLHDNPMGIFGNGILDSDESYEVDLKSIDCLSLEKLDFIKLDVEGYETKAVNGGIDTIAKCRPVIVLECWSNHQGGLDLEYTKTNFKILLDMGYTVTQIGNSPDWLFLP
jgi:FkbM family methyltransferase